MTDGYDLAAVELIRQLFPNKRFGMLSNIVPGVTCSCKISYYCYIFVVLFVGAVGNLVRRCCGELLS